MTRSQTAKQEHSKRREVVTRDFLAAHAMTALVQAHGEGAAKYAEDEIADAMLKQKKETT